MPSDHHRHRWKQRPYAVLTSRFEPPSRNFSKPSPAHAFYIVIHLPLQGHDGRSFLWRCGCQPQAPAFKVPYFSRRLSRASLSLPSSLPSIISNLSSFGRSLFFGLGTQTLFFRQSFHPIFGDHIFPFSSSEKPLELSSST